MGEEHFEFLLKFILVLCTGTCRSSPRPGRKRHCGRGCLFK